MRRTELRTPDESTGRFMPKHEVENTTGLSGTTIWREYRANRFPRPHRLTPNRVGWLESEVRAWMASRPQTTDQNA